MHLMNPERAQDRAEDLLDNWRKYGYVMFPQQRRIYSQLSVRINHRSVLEAGCGNGTGTALLDRSRSIDSLVATDRLASNVAFARELYPWIDFDLWDMQRPWPGRKFDAVVCVEALEHVADTRAALRNLIGAATQEVWLSTPNGRGKPRPPENPFHVAEYTVAEMRAMIGEVPGVKAVDVLSWESFLPLADDTDVDPLVYRITL